MTKLVSMIQSMHHGNPWHERCYNVNNLIFPSTQGILYNGASMLWSIIQAQKMI